MQCEILTFLKTLGFEVKFDADIAPLVHKTQTVPYDPIALFAIYATKKI